MAFKFHLVDILQLLSMHPINNLLKKFPREFQLSREVYPLVNKLHVNGNCRLIEVFRKSGKCRSTSQWYIDSLPSYFSHGIRCSHHLRSFQKKDLDVTNHCHYSLKITLPWRLIAIVSTAPDWNNKINAMMDITLKTLLLINDTAFNPNYGAGSHYSIKNLRQ